MKKSLAKPSHTFRSYDFSHLSIGDMIEARQGQKVHHCGSVEEAQPDLGLFCVQDAITGRRRLVDFDSYEIFVDPDTGRPVASNTAKARA